MLRYIVLLAAFLLVPSQGWSQDRAADAVTLQPGDVVRVQIWREEDLSGDFPVDDAGVVILPMIGERRVTGIPMRALRDNLIAEFRSQLRNPSITIVPLRRITLLGEVNRPGLYLADPTVTLAGAIALAEGINSNGSMNRIRIVRDGQVIASRPGAAQSLTSIDVRSGDQILVGGRPWIARNAPVVVSTVFSVTTLIIALTNQRDRSPAPTRQ